MQNKTLLINTVPNIAEWSSKDAQPTERATVPSSTDCKADVIKGCCFTRACRFLSSMARLCHASQRFSASQHTPQVDLTLGQDHLHGSAPQALLRYYHSNMNYANPCQLYNSAQQTSWHIYITSSKLFLFLQYQTKVGPTNSRKKQLIVKQNII